MDNFLSSFCLPKLNTEEKMSMYLFDEQPILANKTLARELGLNEALVLQQINYWIEINKKSGRNYHDGKYWTYNSIRAWQANDFDYMSVDTVKRTFNKLEKAGFILVANYNKDPRDKTKWYTINNEKLEELYAEMNRRKVEEEIRVREENLNSELHNALVQNALMENGKMPQCNKADYPNALDENNLMHLWNLPQPLPEITSENTTDKTKENFSVFNQDGRKDGIENKNYLTCLEELRKSTGYYAHLEVGNTVIAESYDQILRVLADVMILQRDDVVVINQVKLPASIVQERYRELDSSHLEYLVRILTENEKRIRNVRAFILTAAYNAPSSIDAYYQALVNYDWREGNVG